MADMFRGWYNQRFRPADFEHGWPTDEVKSDLLDTHANQLYCCQLPWELAQVLDLYVERKPMRILEIGSCRCGTTYYWCKHAPPGSTVVAVDIEFAPEPLFYELIARDAPEVKFEFIGGSSAHPAVRDAALHVLGGEIDWCFIDGDHGIVGLEKDFLAYGSRVVSGGVIGIHDILMPNTVALYWRKIQAAGYITQEIVADPGLDSFGIGLVFPQNQRFPIVPTIGEAKPGLSTRSKW